MKTRKVDNQVRRNELAAIHVAKKQLNLDDTTYRTMLFTITRKRSAADLDHAERQAVIEHLRKRGFVRLESTYGTAPAAEGRPSVAADRLPLVNKIQALLDEAGRPWQYARAMAERMFKLQLEWCVPGQLHDLVAALEIDKKRRAARSK